MKKVSRRELAKIAAGLAAASAVPMRARGQVRSGYSGPLTGVDPDLTAGRGFDPAKMTTVLKLWPALACQLWSFHGSLIARSPERVSA